MRFALLLALALAAPLAQAAAPVPATVDRSQWPEQLNSPVLFDVASRAEILGFARALRDSERLAEAELALRLGLRQINLASINTLRERLWQRLAQNYAAASQSCSQDASFCYAIEDLAGLREQAGEYAIGADSFYAQWAAPSAMFHQRYLDELLHMAALFPQISSEIERFSGLERNGDELKDRVFLLTFEGGPALASGNTEWLADYLRRQQLRATFFVLGNNLQKRRDGSQGGDLRAIYRDQCVGVQGWEYRSHSQWLDWQSSVLRSLALVQNELPRSYVAQFRPPYGQRRSDSQEFFASQRVQVVLWDIDSLDGDPRVSADQSAQRVLTLMLLWRKGIISFHDSEAKAQAAVPWLLQRTAQSGIAWEDCRDFDEMPGFAGH
ncbi:polysaccharide deacetylase family protein [Pseudomonas sp. nanlin1]|uniref:polysaccharide deacetylase family protein n=1 Tax=Pseudomonas sp. nanlin1 TaxID=3040605 RepID=UPI00388E33E2